MLYIDDIGNNTIRFGNAQGGGSYPKFLSKPLYAESDLLGRVWIKDGYTGINYLNCYDPSQITLEGTVYEVDDFVSEFNIVGTLLNYPAILADGNTDIFFDTSKLSKMTLDGSNRCSSIQSVIKAIAATQGTLNNQPVYSAANGLSFDGSNDTLQTPAIAAMVKPITVYLVVKQNTWTLNDSIFDGITIGSGLVFQNPVSPGIALSANGGVTKITRDYLAVGNWGIVTAVLNGASSSLQVDEYDEITGNIGDGDMGGLTLGGAGGTTSYRANCSIKAVIARHVADTADSKKIIRTFLREKFATANLIAISGQSNAVGYYPDSALPAAANGNQGEKFIYFKDLTGDEFQVMNPAVNCGYDWIADPDDNTGWGAEQGAAIDLLADTKNDVIVVKSGTADSQITAWDAGTAPFNDLVSGFKRALNNTDSLVKYKTYEKLSLLWIQGESDAINSKTTAYYEAKMRDLIARLRASDWRLANLQIVMLKLSDLMTAFSLDATKRGEINTAFANIAADTANTVVLDPDSIAGIALRADNLHYTAASLLLIGSAWRDLMS